MRTAAALVAGFAGGFLFAGWCLSEALKDGSIDDLIDAAREKFPRPTRATASVIDFNSLLDV